MSLRRLVYVVSDTTEHTTARYLARAIDRALGWGAVYVGGMPDLGELRESDVVLFVDPLRAWPLGLEAVGCPRLAYFIDVHLDLSSRLRLSRFFEVVLVAQKDLLTPFVELGHHAVSWLPLACDPETHAADVAQHRPFEVGFVGSLQSKGTRRHSILTSVLPNYRTNDWLRFHTPREMGEVYGRSKIVFNVSVGGDVNMRVFEAMAAGAMLITDRVRNGLSELFTEGTHYVGYSSIEEAHAVIRRFLAEGEQRQRIASEGQRAVLAHHTYDHRWESVRARIGQRRGAPTDSMSRAALAELYSAIFVHLRQPWRLRDVHARYGSPRGATVSWVKAWARWLNVRVPLTPNAIRARLTSPRTIRPAGYR